MQPTHINHQEPHQEEYNFDDVIVIANEDYHVCGFSSYIDRIK